VADLQRGAARAAARRRLVARALIYVYAERVAHADLAAFAGRFATGTGRPLDLRPAGDRDE